MKSLSKVLMLLLTAALLLACAGCASAEEILWEEDSVELYSAGGFAEPISLPQTYAVQSFEDFIVEQLLAQTEMISLTSYDLLYEEEFKPLYQDVLNKHPELFNVESRFRRAVKETDRGEIISVLAPYYKYTGDELAEMTAVYNSGVDAIVDYAMEADTDVGRLLRASDYMCVNFEYDKRILSTDEATKDLTVYSPEQFFVQKTGVCQAYMLTYHAVMEKMGLTTEVAVSDAMAHIWNLVKLDGAWYHIDVTWNDARNSSSSGDGEDMPLRALHKYFLLSDDGMAAVGHHDWTSPVTASNTKYDSYFWINLKHPAPMVGDVVYYADDSVSTYKPKLCSFDLATGTRKALFTYQYTAGSVYQGNHAVWATDRLVFFALRNKLYAATHNGGSATSVFQTDTDTEKIFQMYQEGDQLKIHATENPNYAGKVYTIDLFDVALKSPSFIDLTVGDRGFITTFDTMGTLKSNSDETIVSVGEDGMLTAKAMGVVTLVFTKDGTDTSIPVVVHSKTPFVLPAKTETISPSAFAGIAAQEIVLPEGTLSIGSGAFAGCTALKLINLPASLFDISDTAFDGIENAVLICEGEKGEVYAKAMGLPYVVRPAE